MKQVLLKTGKTLCEEVPAPVVSEGRVLIRVVNSCISAGTELKGIEASGKSIFRRALEEPDKAKKAVEMIKDAGPRRVLNRISSELDAMKPIGYSCSGVVIDVGGGINDLRVGDRVAAAGVSFANHAEVVEVPRNLIVKLPPKLGFREASTVALGSIAMQGVRRADLRLGETAVVVGLGVIGQITAQLLRASGCKVIGIDMDNRRVELAASYGIELSLNSSNCDVVQAVYSFTHGYGADAVIFTAATTSSDALSISFQMCRKKGRVVLVGVSGMQIKRSDIYSKELDFLISTSYGPGRYDDSYEINGNDYPYAYVRWTENRNMEEYLRLLEQGFIRITDLIEEVFPVEKVEKAYERLKNDNPPLFVLLEYNRQSKTLDTTTSNTVQLPTSYKRKVGSRVNVAIIGAGSFAKGMHLPNLQRLSKLYNVHAIMSRTGANAKEVAMRYGARYATTSIEEVLQDEQVDMVMICTRHQLHAELAINALKAGKAVFVEKPMATNLRDLDLLERELHGSNVPYMVGYNRRFSPHAREVKKHVDQRQNPLVIDYRMNASYIPLDNWVHAEGGRIVGEACHIVDLFNYFIGAEVESVSVNAIRPRTRYYSARDNVVITLRYKDGSLATLTYVSVGNKAFPKESMELFYDNKVIKMIDYQYLESYGLKIQNSKFSRPDKGHLDELREFHSAVVGETPSRPIATWDMIQTTRVTLVVDNEIRAGS